MIQFIRFLNRFVADQFPFNRATECLEKQTTQAASIFPNPFNVLFLESYHHNILKENGIIFLKYTASFLLCSYFLVQASKDRIAKTADKVFPSSKSKVQNAQTLFVTLFFVIPVLVTIPIYINIQDWGRWFFVSNMSFAFCLLSKGLVGSLLQNDKTISTYDVLMPHRFIESIRSVQQLLLSRSVRGPRSRILIKCVELSILVYVLLILRIPHVPSGWRMFAGTMMLRPWVIDLLN